jgi:hypothetical protein
MGHVVKDAGWCVIDIDTKAGRVFLQERWQYNWLVQPPLTPWTYHEKRGFHARADREIWAAWSNRARLGVSGTSDLAKKFASSGIPINLDVRWVLKNPHWNVNVTKIPSGQFNVSNVQWNARVINLDTNDFNTRTHCNGTPKVCTVQTPVSHEFGHAAGNTAVLGRGDEYKTTSPHHGDQGSILHSGSMLRSRHFQTILDEMNTMVSGTTFSVKSI